MKQTVRIALTTTTGIEHNGRGKLSSSYTTTIPIDDVPFKVARTLIRQIADEIAARINEDFRVEIGQRNTSTYILRSVTKDIRANRYCFAAEYSETVSDFVERYPEADIEVNI